VILVLRQTIGIRIDITQEVKGIDVQKHGGHSYSEFKTTVTET
jgi:ammonia channel protein AmtB